MKPWDCVECGSTVTEYGPGVCHDDGTHWLICGPCFGRYEATFLPPKTDRWGDEQGHDGECNYCSRLTRVMLEPFGHRDACKPCWEQVCYGGEGETA